MEMSRKSVLIRNKFFSQIQATPAHDIMQVRWEFYSIELNCGVKFDIAIKNYILKILMMFIGLQSTNEINSENNNFLIHFLHNLKQYFFSKIKFYRLDTYLYEKF